ncbi:MAG TPA: class I SAM-dependent methyltransferase [Puia sp.]|jgi:SAM-dependent methyltransferase|nr:class I SAM-dependent methyltransferase [Puia sp.]
MSDSTTRFSDRVEDYVKYRPHYPEAVVEYLRATYGLKPEWSIADIGSGTGISTELFLRNGNRVYGIEPNRGMREKGEQLLAGYARRRGEGGRGAEGRGSGGRGAEDAFQGEGGGNFISIEGTAEATGLADGSVDMIVAGQAFHWFDPVQSRGEFARILRSGGVVVLIWNERLIVSPFEKEYEDLILRHASDYNAINHKNISDGQFREFFHPAAFALAIFPNEQLFDFEGLKGRLLSSSYIPKEGSRHVELMRGLRELFDRHAAGGRVRVGYDTKVYSGVLKP